MFSRASGVKAEEHMWICIMIYIKLFNFSNQFQKSKYYRNVKIYAQSKIIGNLF